MKLIIVSFCFLFLGEMGAQPVLSIHSTPAQAADTIKEEGFSFSPSFGGGQFELTSVLYVSELGALVDIDLFKMHSIRELSFGTRFAFEAYGYFEPGGPTGGGPFKDYSFYLFHSARSENVHFNFLGGLTYHTRKRNAFYGPDEILFRAGFEVRFNPFHQKMFAILLKASTSFKERTGFAGVGIAMGFYK